MTEWVLILIALLVLIVVVAIGVWRLSRYEKNTQAQINVLEQQLGFKTQQLLQTRHELEELRSGVIGVGQRVLQLDGTMNIVEQQLLDLANKQQELELVDPESKIYTRAVKMVQLGADLDEIIRECELPRAEAELLINLHQLKA